MIPSNSKPWTLHLIIKTMRIYPSLCEMMWIIEKTALGFFSVLGSPVDKHCTYLLIFAIL